MVPCLMFQGDPTKLKVFSNAVKLEIPEVIPRLIDGVLIVETPPKNYVTYFERVQMFSKKFGVVSESSKPHVHEARIQGVASLKFFQL